MGMGVDSISRTIHRHAEPHPADRGPPAGVPPAGVGRPAGVGGSSFSGVTSLEVEDNRALALAPCRWSARRHCPPDGSKVGNRTHAWKCVGKLGHGDPDRRRFWLLTPSQAGCPNTTRTQPEEEESGCGAALGLMAVAALYGVSDMPSTESRPHPAGRRQSVGGPLIWWTTDHAWSWTAASGRSSG